MTSARILIVEDVRIITQARRRRLTALGHTVVGKAASGKDAVAQADTLRPNVVLLDIGLRGAMDGVEAARQTGPAGYLVKPVLAHELRAALARAVDGPMPPDSGVPPG